MITSTGYYVIAVLLMGCLYYVSADGGGTVFTDCGGVFEEPTGILQTPGFPGPYPNPIKCEWLIHAKPGKKIILYLTQNFMKDSFHVSVYQAYRDTSTYVGRQDYGEITWQHVEVLSLVAYQPYMLIQFEVDFIGDRQLRVIDHLLDVYGFNITYEIVDANANVSKDTCSVNKCSYLGNCIVSADYKNFECQCFDGFFGDQCQYGPYCDPNNNVNACNNNGRCRYFFGSLINQCECPPGYGGAYCEMKSLPVDNIASECESLACISHSCGRDSDGLVKCLCNEGYMLGPMGTCLKREFNRYDVFLQVRNLTSNALLQESFPQIEKDIYTSLLSSGLTTATRLQIHELSNDLKLHVSFYCNKSEQALVPGALGSLVALGRLGDCILSDEALSVQEYPELELIEIQKFDQTLTLRGSMLTLSCAAKGSPNMEFRWFKDGVRVDTTLTQRNAWENVVPPTDNNKVTLSVLSIDIATPIDQGVFTCSVTDYGDSLEKSIVVTLHNYPRVQLDPMSLSVTRGQKISIKCLSPDDSWVKFEYEWFKNGKEITPFSRKEYSEVMFPTGVQLVVPSMEQTSEYTCRVTNKAGSSNVSAYIFVIPDNETVQFCPREYVGQVMWSNTTGGHFDVKRCPTEQGEESFRIYLGEIDIGYARRNCHCDPGTRVCKWSKPNFSRCQSLVLIHTYDELELLRNGYQQTNLTKLFDDLYSFALTEKQGVILYSGDMDMIAGILTKLVSHMKAFPQTNKIDAKRLVDLISAVLRRTAEATADEKREIMVGPSIVQTIHTLVSGCIQHFNFTTGPRSFSDTVDVQTAYLTKVKLPTDDQQNVGSYKKRSPDTDGETIKVYKMTTSQIVDLLNYRDLINNAKESKAPLLAASRLYSVNKIEDKVSSFEATTVLITIFHDIQHVGRSNTTACIRWDFDPKNIYSGHWSSGSCITRESYVDRTVCECELPGHFIAAIVPLHNTLQPKNLSDQSVSLPLVVGYSITIVFITITAATYIRNYSMLPGDIYIAHLNFMVSALGYLIICFITIVMASTTQTYASTAMVLITYLVYVGFITLLIETFQLYLLTFKISRIRITTFKLILIAWGIPILMIIPFIVVFRMLDTVESIHALCWLYGQANQLYVFIVTLIVELVIHSVLTILCLLALRSWLDDWRYSEKINYFRAVMCNASVCVFWLIATCSAINLTNTADISHMAIHVTFLILFGVCVLLTRCIIDKNIRSLCARPCWDSSMKQNARDQKDNMGFRSYMKPEHVTNGITSQEEYNVSKYYDEVNRTKYTTERKRQLSALLGSSSSYSDTKSTTVSFNTNEGSSKESNAPSFSLTTESCSGTDVGLTLCLDTTFAHVGGASGSIKDADKEPVSEQTGEQTATATGIVPKDKQACVNGRAAPNSDNHDKILKNNKQKHKHPSRTPTSSDYAQYSPLMGDHQSDSLKRYPDSCPSNQKRCSNNAASERMRTEPKPDTLTSDSLENQPLCKNDKSNGND